ncbi:MAG: TlpA disulfide reductase family protein [Rhodoferax sp.]|nr:TlpA disulfide reductase family protein [Rhodoferax sp.]
MLTTALFRGKPLLVNFWATWCPPCVEELPLLNAFYRQHAANGWQIIGLALDQAAPVRRFLKQQPLAFPVALAGFAGVELSRSLGNINGGLPFSVVFDPSGTLVYRKLGKLSKADLQNFQHLLT